MNPCNVFSFRCARCGMLRGASNGWFVMAIEGGWLLVRHIQKDEPPLDDGDKALCSASCLFAEIGERIGKAEGLG